MIKSALHDYSSLSKFSFHLDITTASYTPDEQWTIADLSDISSNKVGY